MLGGCMLSRVSGQGYQDLTSEAGIFSSTTMSSLPNLRSVCTMRLYLPGRGAWEWKIDHWPPSRLSAWYIPARFCAVVFSHGCTLKPWKTSSSVSRYNLPYMEPKAFQQCAQHLASSSCLKPDKLIPCHLVLFSWIHILLLSSRSLLSPGPSTAGSTHGPLWIIFFRFTPARADQLRIFTLNWKGRLSIAEWIGLGPKGFICTIGK